MHTCHPCIWALKAGASEVQKSKASFEASLGCMKPCFFFVVFFLKNNKINKKSRLSTYDQRASQGTTMNHFVVTIANFINWGTEHAPGPAIKKMRLEPLDKSGMDWKSSQRAG